MSFNFRYREDPSRTVHESPVDLDQEDTETESESEESCDDQTPLYRDEEVFLGPVSSEEIRVNKRIGGRRSTFVPRPSVLPSDCLTPSKPDVESRLDSLAEDDDDDEEEDHTESDAVVYSPTETREEKDEDTMEEEDTPKEEPVDHNIMATLIQSVWKMAAAQKKRIHLKKEREAAVQSQRIHESMSQLLRQEVLPSLCEQVETIRRSRAREQAECAMQQMIVRWQEKKVEMLSEQKVFSPSPESSHETVPEDEPVSILDDFPMEMETESHPTPMEELTEEPVEEDFMMDENQEDEEDVALIEVSMEEEEDEDDDAVEQSPQESSEPSENMDEEPMPTEENTPTKLDDTPLLSQAPPVESPTTMKQPSPDKPTQPLVTSSTKSKLPDIVQTIRQRTPIGGATSTLSSTRSLEDRLAALRKARMALQQEVPSPLDAPRTITPTVPSSTPASTSGTNYLAEKQQFLAQVQQKRMARREKLLSARRGVLTNKENVNPV